MNILPKKIARRLKRKENPIADHFEEVSITFIDFVDFTSYSLDKDPNFVVEKLNEIFTKFDSLAEKYGLEKIKTIGDCYMAVAGLPEPRKDHAEAIACFSLDAMNIIDNLRNENSDNILFRCGIDCGPVIAGVIGDKKFIYDLWGDAVNTASRMEGYCEPGKILVTDRFVNQIKHSKLKFITDLPDINFVEHGLIEVKGKGKMKTWYLLSN